MRSFFHLLTLLALRFRAVTLVLVVAVIVAGGVAGTQLKQELLPPIEFPQTVILAQASGMTSEQVLTVITTRLEDVLLEIPEIVNVESTTSGTFGTAITAANDFGLDQDRLREDIRAALQDVWFPVRAIQAPAGEDATAFAASLIGDLTPETMLYLASRNSNVFFQLAPEIWATLPEETVRQMVIYLANTRTTSDAGGSALERLVEKQFVPQLNAVDIVANVTVDGGQTLPGEEALVAEALVEEEVETALIRRLSPDVWRLVAERLGLPETLDDAVVADLQQQSAEVPTEAPPLPESWRFDHFSTVQDLLELGQSSGNLLNDFYETGLIRGALGQTDDLSPEDIERMLALEPSMVDYFEAEHLTAMSPDVFAALPDDFINDLDGFTSDALAAAALAETVTGDNVAPDPVNLPAPWRISPPQLVTFSFADLPLVTYSVFSTATPGDTASDSQDDASGDTETETSAETTNAESAEATADETTPEIPDLPEGPALPTLYSVIGEQFGAELDTADDLAFLRLSGDAAEQFGVERLSAAEFLNSLLLFGDQAAGFTGGGDGEGGGIPGDFDITQFATALSECGVGVLQVATGDFNIAETMIGCLSADTVAYLRDNVPDFVASLDGEVLSYFSDDVLALEGLAPPLGDAWNTLAEQPEFEDRPLRTADDLLALGDGEASAVLNTINATVPDRFAGYEVRLFDSLSPTTISYLRDQEADFIANLDPQVLLKFSPEVLATFSDETLASFDDEVVQQAQAIASGEQSSAAQELQDRYATDVPAADPSAPELNPQWQQIASFIPGTELNNAFDFFRFSDAFGTPAEFFNSFLTGPGSNFAPNLFGNLSQEAFNYIAERDEDFISQLEPGVLLLLSDEVFESLPESTQERAEEGQVFRPTSAITRTNGSSSLLVTVFKDTDANTVDSFYAIQEVVERLDAENENIEVNIAFEQSSFVESSIIGVAREGSLGAVFAILNILVFLSGGFWPRRGRSIVGAIVVVAFASLLTLLIVRQMGLSDVGPAQAFAEADTLTRVLLIGGLLIGLYILLWPGKLPFPAWRATIVIGISIPLSIFAALMLMNWVPPVMNDLLTPLAQDSPIFGFLIRLFPESLTLNIMTLSGLTVAVGRVVDDSIVVLENIVREIQSGKPKREAIETGARDVSVAIFSATSIAVVVFLPLGLTGGIIGEFFLPFGLAVSYALLSSFLIAITVIPALAYFFIDAEDLPEEEETWMQRTYVPVLRWAISSSVSRWLIIIFAFGSMIFGFFLFGQRPAAFLPEFGEPQIQITVEMPQETGILETNDLTLQMEEAIREEIPEEELTTIRTTVGGGGFDVEALLGTGAGVSENVADITISIGSGQVLEEKTPVLRERAESIFGEGNVTVSAATLASGGGFGGFEMVVSGPNQEVLNELNEEIIATLNEVDGITNVSSNLVDAGDAQTYIRINGSPALAYTGELETDDTLGVTEEAIEYVQTEMDLPEGVMVSQGFDSEIQSEGFASLFVAMGIALVIVVGILLLVFRSPVYWLALILSIVVAPVGAAIALTITDRVLGISALIGLLMLLGLVVTNAIVLIDRVRSNRELRDMNLHDAIIEAGARRVRPILMTALATIIALIPLAVGLSEGAIIASELGTVVIGGVMSSTLLMLLVVPVAYYLLTPLHEAFVRLLPGGRRDKSKTDETA